MPITAFLRLCLAVVLSASPIVLTCGQSAQAQTPKVDASSFILSTATTGGAFHQGGVSLSALVKIKLLPDKHIDLTAENSSGSIQNIVRLRSGAADFGIVQGLLGYHARLGTGPAQDIGRQPELRAVTMLWPNVEHFIVRKSAAANGSIKDLLGLNGQKMSFGREESAIESNRFLLENLGMDIGRDFEQSFLGFRGSVTAFERGDINGLSLPASTPVPAFIDLLSQLGPDATILNWTDEDLARADGGLGLWSPISIPAKTYPGQTEVIKTIAQPNFLAVRADVDDEVVYEVTKAIFENLPFLRRLHEPFRFLTLERAVEGLPVPLHPGALRYFQEIRLEMDHAVMAEHDYDVFGQGVQNVEGLRQNIRRGLVSMMTPEDGTSDQLVNELLDVLGKEDDLRVLPLKGKGTAHNLADLLYLSGVDVSLLQTDTMDYARRQNIFPNLTQNIRYITKWHDLEVHLLVQDDILGLDHLRGKPVNFGPVGSGSELTAATLFNKRRLAVKQTSFSHDVALQKLKDGEIAGMVLVAGKPIPLFQGIEVRDGLRLLSLPTIDDRGDYRAATITELDYPTLVFGKRTIETLAVPSVLVAYNWPVDHERYQPIAKFVDALLTHLEELQAVGRHPKWQEVDPAYDLDSWQRHQASEAYLKQSKTADKSIGQGGPLVPSADVRDMPTPPQATPAGVETKRIDRGAPSKRSHNHRRPVF